MMNDLVCVISGMAWARIGRGGNTLDRNSGDGRQEQRTVGLTADNSNHFPKSMSCFPLMKLAEEGLPERERKGQAYGHVFAGSYLPRDDVRSR